MVRNIARFWKVRPMPRPAIWCVGVLVIDLPSKRMSPAWYWYRRLRQLNSVVLPAPFGPIRPQMSPRRTSKLTPSSATMPPKRTVTPRTLSKGSALFDMGVRSRFSWLGARPGSESVRVIGCRPVFWQSEHSLSLVRQGPLAARASGERNAAGDTGYNASTDIHRTVSSRSSPLHRPSSRSDGRPGLKSPWLMFLECLCLRHRGRWRSYVQSIHLRNFIHG